MTEVPKFGSFKPARSAPVTIEEPQLTEPSTKHKSEKRHRSSGKHGERKHEEKKHRHSRHRSRSREGVQPLLKSEPSRAPEDHELVDFFVVDRQGNEKNLTYGSIHRYSVPSFYRFGAGYVLGLSRDFRIDRNLGDDKSLAIGRRDAKTRTREKYVFSKVAKEKPRLLKIRPATDSAEATTAGEDFVPLTKSRKRKRSHDGDAVEGNSSESEKDERDYRSIYGKGKSKEVPSDDEFQYASESDFSGSDAGHTMKINSAVQTKSIELSRAVEQNPNEIENWLALIEHQDVLLQSSTDRRRITNAETKSTAEIKIHMYEKALEKMTTLQDREHLLLGLMAEGLKIWDVKDQSNRWEQISNDNIDSLLLWTSYLNFKQSNFPTFRYEEIKELYLSRIKLLRNATLKAKPESIKPLLEQLIYVLLRFTLFIRESGYSELAIAIWQALLELNFFAPSRPLSQEKPMDSFKDFWEGEVLRVGEEGALGWRKFAEDENSSEIPNAIVDEAGESLNDKDLFNSWSCAETARSQNLLPARTMDEVIEDDPFRVILFSDIADYIVIIPPEVEQLRALLLDAFLLFCRLPIVSRASVQPENWSLDSFIRNELFGGKVEWTEHSLSQDEKETSKQDAIATMLNCQLTNYQNVPEVMFGGSDWFRSRSWHECFPNGNEPVPYRFVRNVLKQLTHSSDMEELAEYHLAFEHIHEPTTIKKSAKAVLKRYPSSLRLYNAYAMIEWHRNKEIANGVFTAALNMSLTSDNKADNGCILLWKSWIWASIEDKDTISALGLLLSIVDGQPDSASALTPALLLKSKQLLTSTRDFLLSSGSVDDAVMYGECLALLEYLTAITNTEPRSSTQGDIASALSSYTAFSLTLQTRGPSPWIRRSHELLLQSASRLLLHHARAGPYRPSLLRFHFSSFIILFPQNTIFLSLFAWNERNLRVENRVRNILSSVILTPAYDNIASRVFAIDYEISHGTIHSAKAAFEHALASTACMGNAGLWRFYILYLLSIPTFNAKAKEVWYRAIRACPWAKGLYVLGLGRLGETGMGFAEMKCAWRVMGEKELRVHVDLEDAFEEIGEREEREEREKVDAKVAVRGRLGFK